MHSFLVYITGMYKLLKINLKFDSFLILVGLSKPNYYKILFSFRVISKGIQDYYLYKYELTYYIVFRKLITTVLLY